MSDYLIQRRCVVFSDSFFYVGYFYGESSFSEGNFDYIPDRDVVGCSGDLSVYGNVTCITGVVCDCSAFDYSGNFKIFIKSHTHINATAPV